MADEKEKKGFKRSIKGTFGKLFARTDIPMKVKANAGQTVKTKNIVYVSGSKTWKAKAETAAQLNYQLGQPVEKPVPNNQQGFNLDFNVSPSEIGSQMTNPRTLVVQNGDMRMEQEAGNLGNSMNSSTSGHVGSQQQQQSGHVLASDIPAVAPKTSNGYSQNNGTLQQQSVTASTSYQTQHLNASQNSGGGGFLQPEMDSPDVPAAKPEVSSESPRREKKPLERRESERVWNPYTKDKNTYRHQYFIQTNMFV